MITLSGARGALWLRILRCGGFTVCGGQSVPLLTISTSSGPDWSLSKGITMLKTSLLSSVTLIALGASHAAAQEAIALDEVIFSGGLSPIAAQSYGRAASVITAQEIEDRGITNVADALRSLPGVSVSAVSNSYNQVRIRGGEANHTLVLIDGVEASGGDSEYIFSGLETANIERIEVLRGPQSVYYGSNASSGVINIITRNGNIGTTYSGSLEVGEATIATAFMSHRTERGGVALSLAHTNDQGFDQSGDGGEKDGLERTSAILSGDYLVTGQLKLGFNIRKSRERYEFDIENYSATTAADYVVDDPDLDALGREFTATVYGEYSAMDGRLLQRLSFERTHNRYDRSNFAAVDVSTESYKYNISYGLDGRRVEDSSQLVTFLIDTRDDESKSNALYARSSKSIAAEYRGVFSNGLNLQAGLRYDDNDVFKDATTWNVAAKYFIPDTAISVHASAGAGVVNPTYFELYTDSNFFGVDYKGNTDLQPERNESFDVGVEFPIFDGRGTMDITYFRERLENEIKSSRVTPTLETYINQTGISTREGVEVSGDVQATDAIALRMSYTYLSAKNPDGSVEIRRPRHELSLGTTVQTFNGRGSVSADIRHVSGNYDTKFYTFPYETDVLPSYTTVDVAADYDLTDNLTLTGRVTNLFDDDAVDVWGFANRGRAAYVGLRANF